MSSDDRGERIIFSRKDNDLNKYSNGKYYVLGLSIVLLCIMFIIIPILDHKLNDCIKSIFIKDSYCLYRAKDYLGLGLSFLIVILLFWGSFYSAYLKGEIDTISINEQTKKIKMLYSGQLHKTVELINSQLDEIYFDHGYKHNLPTRKLIIISTDGKWYSISITCYLQIHGMEDLKYIENIIENLKKEVTNFKYLK